MTSPDDDKQRQLEAYRLDPCSSKLTTDHGIPVGETDNSLTVGERGP